ncbi:transposable element Tcb1 transposase [Trichonephila clavipes]|nr:transposable element Tcb1 transposase [Trichonephila clavipes]
MRRYAGLRNGGACLSSIKHVVGTTSGCFYPRSNHWEVGGRPQCDKCGCRVRIAHISIVSRLWRQFQTTGTAIRGFSSGRPRGTTPADDRYIVLQARRNRRQTAEKSLDTRHRRLDDRYRVCYGGQKTARWWCVCTTPCTMCTFNACPSEKSFYVVPGTPELRDNEWGRVLLQMRADSV